MGNVNNVNHISPRPVDAGDARRTDSLPEKRSRQTGFDERLSNDAAPRVSERRGGEEKRGGQLSEEAWLRQRTLEELKTLVRAIEAGVTDPYQLTDLIFYARHPEMIGVPLTGQHQQLLEEWNSISALLVHPAINEVSDFLGVNVQGGEIKGAEQMGTAFERASHSSTNINRAASGNNRYDDVIARAVEWCPGLSPSILKGLLAVESGFNPKVINQYGYAGIAQFGRAAAREVGLHVGVAGSATDERLEPLKAIPGAARLLNIKAQRLSEMAFSRYGQPNGTEFWKFVLAAYNGGEATVSVAMGHAYRNGLAQARSKGLVGTEAVSFARNFASKWDNLKLGGMSSPLGLAATRYFPKLAAMKYQEIGNYPTAIVAHALKSRA